MREYMEWFADYIEDKLIQMDAVDRCPECGKWTNRKVEGQDRRDITYNCPNCEWDNE